VVFVIDVAAVVVTVGMLLKTASGLSSFWQLNAIRESRSIRYSFFM